MGRLGGCSEDAGTVQPGAQRGSSEGPLRCPGRATSDSTPPLQGVLRRAGDREGQGWPQAWRGLLAVNPAGQDGVSSSSLPPAVEEARPLCHGAAVSAHTQRRGHHTRGPEECHLGHLAVHVLLRGQATGRRAGSQNRPVLGEEKPPSACFSRGQARGYPEASRDKSRALLSKSRQLVTVQRPERSEEVPSGDHSERDGDLRSHQEAPRGQGRQWEREHPSKRQLSCQAALTWGQGCRISPRLKAEAGMAELGLQPPPQSGLNSLNHQAVIVEQRCRGNR